MIRKTVRVWSTAGAMIATGFVSGNIAQTDRVFAQAAPSSGHSMQGNQTAGEGEGASVVKSEADFLHALGLVEGHMTVGVFLYSNGDFAQARTHMKHPRDELYAVLVPELKKRNKQGFDKELSAVASSVEAGAAAQDVNAKMQTLRDALDRNGAPSNARARLEAAAKLVRTAAAEYAVGVKGGKIVNAHEYQDAWGFVQVAIRLIESAPADQREKNASQFAAARQQVLDLKKAWADIQGKQSVSEDSTLLAAAAARIELAALSIR